MHLEERVGEESLEVAGEPGQATGDRCVDELGAGHALGVEVEQPGALRWSASENEYARGEPL